MTMPCCPGCLLVLEGAGLIFDELLGVGILFVVDQDFIDAPPIHIDNIKDEVANDHCIACFGDTSAVGEEHAC